MCIWGVCVHSRWIHRRQLSQIKSMRALEYSPPLHPSCCQPSPPLYQSIHPSIHPSILPAIHLTSTNTASPLLPLRLILHPQHSAQTPGEIMSACQPLCSDRLEQSLFFFVIPIAHVKADMIGTHLQFWLLCLRADFVGESLLRFWYGGKAPLTARATKVRRAPDASLSVNAGVLLSPKLLLLRDVLHCWVIMESSWVLPRLNTKGI